MTIRVAVAASSSRSWLTNRTVLRVVAQLAARASAWPGRRGSCRARRAGGCRRRRAAATSSASRFCSPPQNVRSGRSATSSRPSPTARLTHSSQGTSSVVAAGVAPGGEGVGVVASGRTRPGVLGGGQPLARRPAAAPGRATRAARAPSSAPGCRRRCRRAGASRRAGRRSLIVPSLGSPVAGDQPHAASTCRRRWRRRARPGRRCRRGSRRRGTVRSPPGSRHPRWLTWIEPTGCPSARAPERGNLLRVGPRLRRAFRPVDDVAHRDARAPPAAGAGVVVLDLRPSAGQLDPNGVAVDVDDDLVAALRPPLARSWRARRACRSRPAAPRPDARRSTGSHEHADGVRPAGPSSSRSAWPRRRGRPRRASAAIVWASTSPVTSSTFDLELHGVRPGRGVTACVGRRSRRSPARRWVARRVGGAGAVADRSTVIAGSGPEPVGQRHQQGHAGRGRELHRGVDADDRRGALGEQARDGGRRVGERRRGRRGPFRGPTAIGEATIRSMPSECERGGTRRPRRRSSRARRPRGTRRRRGRCRGSRPRPRRARRTPRWAVVRTPRGGRRRRAARRSLAAGRCPCVVARRGSSWSCVVVASRRWPTSPPAAALHPLERHRVAVDAEPGERAGDDVGVGAGIDERAEHHVAGDAGRAVEVGDGASGSAVIAADIRATAHAAPKPLSMPTTVTPLAHEACIASSAVTPSSDGAVADARRHGDDRRAGQPADHAGQRTLHAGDHDDGVGGGHGRRGGPAGGAVRRRRRRRRRSGAKPWARSVSAASSATGRSAVPAVTTSDAWPSDRRRLAGTAGMPPSSRRPGRASASTRLRLVVVGPGEQHRAGAVGEQLADDARRTARASCRGRTPPRACPGAGARW